MEDSQSSERGSIPLGTRTASPVIGRFFYYKCDIVGRMGNSVFDRLISDLTLEERRNLRDKLKTNVTISSEPLISEENEEQNLIEEQLSRLSFFEKIIIFFKTLFTSDDKERVIRHYLIDKLGRATEKKIPGYIHYREKYFTGNFLSEVEKLESSCASLRPTVLDAYGRSKMSFLAFLGGWFLPEIQQRFLLETDPWEIEKNMGENPSLFDVRREIEFRIEDILDSISEEERKMLYRYSRSLHILTVLLKFDFTVIFMKFTQQPGRKDKTGKFSDLRKSLGTLYNILYSLKYPPDKEIFKALYYYSVMKKNNDPSEPGKLEDYLLAAKVCLNTVREFNRTLPLGDIVKILNRNIHYNPLVVSGGEDWFALYKKYWYKQFEQNMNKFSSRKKIERLLLQFADFLGVRVIGSLDYYKNGIWGDDIFIRYEYSAGIAYRFLTIVFMQEMLPPLKLILVDGKFYKEQNRIDFNTSYSTIIKTLEDLKVVDSKLSPGGVYDHKIQDVKNEEGEAAERIEEIKNILKDVDREIEIIIRDFIASLSLMGNLLIGITHGEIGGPFDTLSNLGFIGKGENRELIPSLVKIKLKIDNFLELYTVVFDIEREAEY